jgi:hypothetical protein
MNTPERRGGLAYEHRTEDRHPAFAGNNVRGDDGPLPDERLAAPEFPQKTNAFIRMIVSVRSRPFHTVIERIELIVSTIGGIVDRKRYRVSRILWLD